MLNFDLYTPTRLLLGKGEENAIGALLKPYASKILLHYGGGSIKASGLYDRVTASLRESGVAYVELGGVVPNPRLALVHEGVELCKKEGVELILAVGGGSVIDSAKAIAAGMYYPGDVWEFYEEGKEIDRALPVATILTLPAAGSETSGDTVITNEAKQMKIGHKSPQLRPLLSIMNPELFYTLPKNQIANGIADIMSHVMERYFTNTTQTDFTDGLCETVLKTVLKYGPAVFTNPADYDAWSEVAFAGTIAHNGLVGMGREQDWACHMLEHELSAIYDVAHGAGLAAVTPSWMRYVYKENVSMFFQFAVNVMGVSPDFREQEKTAIEGIDRLEKFFISLGLPSTLRELGIDESKLELMAKKANGIAYGAEFEHTIGGLKKLNWQDSLAILQMAL